MGTRVRDLLMGHLGELRYEPTAKRVRAMLEGTPVADTRAARIFWEPRRIVPVYAVPEADLLVDVVPAGPADPGAAEGIGLTYPDASSRPVLDPSIPFAVHSSPGTALDVVAGPRTLAGAAFRPDDADLAGYVVLDFDSFDWLDENEPVVGHPRDPFHRIDALTTDRHVQISLEGTLLADSRSTVALFETMLPVRWYFHRDDVLAPLGPSELVTYCAYKGRAAYFSHPLPGGDDIAWTYHHPLLDAVPVQDRIAFFTERLDVTLDGEPLPRPMTPWSR